MANISIAAIDKRIARIGKLGAELNEYIHVTAMMIITHASGKGAGDVTRVNALMAAMPNSFRKTALRSWLSNHTPIVLEGGKGQPYKARLSDAYKAIKDDAKRAAAWKLDAANAEPFYAIADKEPEEKDYDLAALIKMVQTLGKRIQGKIDEGKVIANDQDKARDLIRKLENVAA